MNKLLMVTAGFFLAIALTYPQENSKIHTSPKLPPREVLQRMNLVNAWHTRIKIEGQRDGVYSVQLIPAPGNPQLVVQTYAGAVYLFDAESGSLIWKTRVGIPYWAPHPIAYNSHSIFATRRSMLHIINRFDGSQRTYTMDPLTRVATFGYDMAFSPSAAPVADEDTLYVSMSNRFNAFEIPDYDYLEKARRARDKRERELAEKALKKDDKAPKEPYKEEPPEAPGSEFDSAQPDFYWGYVLAGETTEFPPLMAGEQVSVLTSAGSLISLARFGRGDREERFEFKAHGRVSAAAAQHGYMAYFGSDDFNLYAVNMRNGNLTWRHVSGAPILRKPEVTDRDVFVAPERTGLRRLDRFTGREVWTNRDTTRFLAVTANYVYALNQVGKFYVLDGRRGTALAQYDLLDWNIHVANDLTDRIYFAANDGQILCLRPRDSIKPLIVKTIELVKREEKKPVEKKKDEEDKKKDDDKKDDKDKEKDKAAWKQESPSAPFRLVRLEARRSPPLAWEALMARRFWAGP